jgi:glycosyltransferase involved in cell wall biosynthesis
VSILSILLPNHNELNIHEFVDECVALGIASEIIVCTDRYGKGKGWATREALKQATGDSIALLDSDGDIPARMLLRLLPFLEDFDVVVGTKRVNHRYIWRRVVTHLSRIYIRGLFGIQVETQTGIKLFRRKALTDWVADGFIFDCEILAKAKRFGMRMIEVPIEAEISAKIMKGAIWRTLKESLTLKYRLLFLVKK